MKKKIHPGVIAAILVVVIGGVIAGFVFSGRADSKKVDIKSLSPEDLRDPEPARRGDPGYRERITDPPQ